MHILYNVVFIIFGIVYLPYLILTRRYRYGMANRFGILSSRLKKISSSNKIMWIHAVSLGEMKAASILAPLLRKAFPEHKLLFSSVTPTGNKEARRIATGEEAVFYLPFDISFIVDRVARTLRPEIFLCLEAELWPNLISSLYKFNTKIVLVNGRISDRSYPAYRKVKFLISRILKKFSLVLMQSERDAVRALALGAPEDKVFASGNLKFDLSLASSINNRREVRERLKMSEEDILLTGGSTNKGEEEQLIYCFLKLKKIHKNLKLMIAPRHIERIREIEDLLSRHGVGAVRFSEVGSKELSDIFILNTLGNLKTIYAGSDIVFVGGSLVKKRGGQNPIEPAALARPVIVGKYMSNYQDVVKSFLQNEALIQVGGRDELYSAIKFLIDNPHERRKLGANAKDTVEKNSGSSQRSIELILSHIR